MLNELIEKWRKNAKDYRAESHWADSATVDYFCAKADAYDECADELEKLGNSERGC